MKLIKYSTALCKNVLPTHNNEQICNVQNMQIKDLLCKVQNFRY